MDYVRRRDALAIVADSLERLGLRYVRKWSFDEDGLRRLRFDFAVFCGDGDDPSFLVICEDGAATSDAALAAVGVRPCRRHIAAERARLRLAGMCRVAAARGVPCLVLDDVGALNAFSKLRAWSLASGVCPPFSETDVVRALDSVEDDLVYVLPSAGPRLRAVMASGVVPSLSCEVLRCDDAPCMSGGSCPHGLL